MGHPSKVIYLLKKLRPKEQQLTIEAEVAFVPGLGFYKKSDQKSFKNTENQCQKPLARKRNLIQTKN